MEVMLTGGCGYIGSHQAVALVEAGHDVVIVDDLTNSSVEVLDRIEQLAGRRPAFHHFDVRDTGKLTSVLNEGSIEAIIHCAGLKHVAESGERPLDYHDVNVGGLLSLLTAANTAGVFRVVFSSSASVYGHVDTLPIIEAEPVKPTNPYSASKAMCERILSDVCEADERWSVMVLRYFNPAGAHGSGLIGEAPTHLLSNLVPVIMNRAIRGQPITIYGGDYDTGDGTAVRDYVHVADVVTAHLRALELLSTSHGFEALNIGRGIGVSVADMVEAACRVTGLDLRRNFGPRRTGDVAALVADTSLAAERLGMVRYRSLDQIFQDAWRWQCHWERQIQSSDVAPPIGVPGA